MDSAGLLSLKWNNHSSTFLHVLENIKRKELYSDVTLACDGKYFPVHKLVLSTCSDYFKEIFEKTQCKHPVIILKDIIHKDLDSLLNYMYIGEVNVLQNELSSLIKAAECLRVKGLAVPDEPPKKLCKRPSDKDEISNSKKTRKNYVSEKKNPDPEKDINHINSHLNSKLNLEENNLEAVKEEIDNMDEYCMEDNTLNETVTKNEENVFADHSLNEINFSNVESQNSSNLMAEALPSTSTDSYIEDQWSGDIETIDDDDDGDFNQLDPGQFTGEGDPSQTNSQIVIVGIHQKNCETTNSATLSKHHEKMHEKDHSANEVSEDTYPNMYRCGSLWNCKHCDYKSFAKNALRSHVRKHTGEKPFSCQFCGSRFSQKCHLKTHIAKVRCKQRK